jgi:hypothetical protein
MKSEVRQPALRLKGFLGLVLSSLLKRTMWLAVLNLFFFGSILVGAILAQFPDVLIYELPLSGSPLDLSVSPLLLFLTIFLFNLVLSGFLLTTFSGLFFFAIPFGLILWRALLWGTLIAQSPSPQFFLALPTLVLEGEAYVIAAVAGVILGLSWLKPSWVYKEEKLSRRLALQGAIRECARLYFWVVLLLAVGAVVETATLLYMR